MKIAAKIACLITLLITSILSHATFEGAVKHYEEGDYQKAFMEFQSLAEIGHKAAQFNLGVMFLEGTAVEPDPVKAYAWIKLSDKKAQKEQAFLKEIFQQLDQDKQKEAEFFYTSLNESFSEEALKSALEPVYTSNRNPVAEEKKAEPKLIKQSAPLYPRDAWYKSTEGWVTVSYQLDNDGRPYDIQVEDSYPGNVFVRNTLKTVKRWKFELPEGSEPYDEVYKYKISFTLSEPSQSNKRLLEEIKKEALSGDPDAQYRYAKFRGKVLFDPDFNPTKWLYKAALQGHTKAQYLLAESLFYGDACEVDREKAVNWLIKAASGNHSNSQLKLAKMLFKTNDKEKAHFWLDKAIESSTPKTAHDLTYYLYSLNDKKYSNEFIIDLMQKLDREGLQYPIKYYQLLAKLHFEQGDYSQAISYQKKAHKELLQHDKVPERMQERLTQYEQALEQKQS